MNLLYCLIDLLLFRPDFFSNPGRLAMTSSQVEQSGSPNSTFPQNFDFLDVGADDWENPFYANTVGNFPHGKGFAITAWISSLYYRSLKLLDTLFVAFRNFYVDVDRITCLERRELGSRLGVFLFYKFK